jgi:DNA repair exonuclease SbcCD ATPase subunit
MALQDMVASRATKPINIFVADEVDHALDESGLERLMTVLNDKAKERGTVLVISHNSLSDWIDNVITVTKEKGYGTVSGAVAA